jgi:hypothetical protein
MIGSDRSEPIMLQILVLTRFLMLAEKFLLVLETLKSNTPYNEKFW